MEAVERFSLFAWWEGHLPATIIGSCSKSQNQTGGQGPTDIRQYRILSPFKAAVVITVGIGAQGNHCYGHAAGRSECEASRHAMTEMARHDEAVRHWRDKGGDHSALNRFDRRALFFASNEGRSLFERRLSRPSTPRISIVRPVFDGPVIGPWCRYAGVWRVVFEPLSNRFLHDGDDYFFW